jgi:hypothetical protein
MWYPLGQLQLHPTNHYHHWSLIACSGVSPLIRASSCSSTTTTPRPKFPPIPTAKAGGGARGGGLIGRTLTPQCPSEISSKLSKKVWREFNRTGLNSSMPKWNLFKVVEMCGGGLIGWALTPPCPSGISSKLSKKARWRSSWSYSWKGPDLLKAQAKSL